MSSSPTGCCAIQDADTNYWKAWLQQKEAGLEVRGLQLTSDVTEEELDEADDEEDEDEELEE